MRTPPTWFQTSNYDYLLTCTPNQWYQEITARRELKALFELRQSEAEIFINENKQLKNDNINTYEEFLKELTERRNQLASLEMRDLIEVHQAPSKIQRYIDFNIVPLFDLLHWYELNEEPTPTHEELKNWLFPDTEKRIRYIVGDAKKMLRLALIECDAFKNLRIKN